MRPIASSLPFSRPALRAIPLDHVEVYQGRGSHKLYTATGPGGVPMFAKHNALKSLSVAGPFAPQVQTFIEKVMPNLDRFEDIRENLLSHIAKAHFDFPTLVYEEACFRDPEDGQVFFGLATPFLKGLDNIENASADSITNPRQAVEASLVKGCLFGDWDVTLNTGNTAIMKEDAELPGGTRLRQGNNVALDYGEGGNFGVSAFNVPFGSAKVLRAWPQYVKPAVDKILGLSDTDIESMVETQGQAHVTGWNAALGTHFTRLLKYNRDALKTRIEKNPDWFDYSKTHNFLRLPSWRPLTKYLLASRAVTGRIKIARSGVLQTLESTASIAARLAHTLPPMPGQTLTLTPSNPPLAERQP